MSGEQDRDALAVERIIADLALTDEASEISTLLNDHAYVPSGLRGVSRCACGLACHGMPHEWRNHVATVLASDWLTDLIAQAEQRGHEDNERHDMCYVHGSKALAAHERRVRASALREAADDYRSGQVTGMFLGRDDYAKAWLRERAGRIEGER